jgi:tetratricopeptide (TPR) repeat protein
MMKSKHKFLPAVCCISLLSACASNQTVSVAPWTIKPVTAINANNKPEAFYQTGRYYQGQNRYDQAIEAYQKALAVDDKFVEARNGLGVILSRQGKYNEAIEAFKLAIQQSPNAAHLYSNMGYAYYLQGQYADAVAALVQATSLDPKNQHALNNLGLAYAKVGQPVDAMQIFSKAALQQSLPIAAADNIPTTSVSEVPVSAVAPVTTSSGYFTLVTAQPAPAKEIAVMVSPDELPLLDLPKDRGIIRPAATIVPMIESSTKLVQLEPHVSELQMQQYKPASDPLLETLALASNSDNAHGAKYLAP